MENIRKIVNEFIDEKINNICKENTNMIKVYNNGGYNEIIFKRSKRYERIKRSSKK